MSRTSKRARGFQTRNEMGASMAETLDDLLAKVREAEFGGCDYGACQLNETVVPSDLAEELIRAAFDAGWKARGEGA